MGYLRFGRRLKIGPGVYVNISKSGLSLSVGPRGAKWTIGPRGSRVTLGLPGTGLSYVIQGSGKRGRRPKGDTRQPEDGGGLSLPGLPALGLPSLGALLGGAREAADWTEPATTPAKPARGRRTPPAADVSPPTPKSIHVPTPGFLAPAVEKRFAQGLRALVDGDAETAVARFQQAVDADTDERHLSDDFMTGVSLLQAGRHQDAIAYLEIVVESEAALPDEIMSRYIGDLRVPAEVTPHVVIDVPMTSLGAALLLAEAYQATGDIFGATGVMEALVEQAPTVALFRLALAELYYEQGHDDGVVTATDGLTAEDDLGYAALTFRALALLAQGFVDPALEVVSGLLKDRRKRPVDLVQDAIFARGMIYDAKGQKEKAQADFERLYAQNSSYPGLREWLEGSYE